MKACAAALFCLLALPASGTAQPAAAPVAPIADPEGLLPAAAKQRMGVALMAFHRRTGRWMAVVIGAERPKIRPEDAPPGVGVVVGFGRDETQPRMVLSDPKWLAGAPKGWADAVAGVLDTRFRHLPFVDRAERGVVLLARVLPDKLEFMARPAARLSAESVAFSKWTMGIFGVLLVIGYFYTAWRSLFDNDVKPTDTDPSSREIKRLRRERNPW